jgi:hemerythrin superfamily protein
MTKEHDATVVGMLMRQHQEISRLLAKVEKGTGKTRAEDFGRLRHLLAVHETAEEEIVHPYARRTISNGARVTESILKEENQAKHLLRALERLDPDSAQFTAVFPRFRKAVLAHAEHEERQEFPQIVARSSPEQLRGMVAVVKAAEAIAPTHPHPGVESPTANVVLGPVAAIMDRTRDAIHRAMS